MPRASAPSSAGRLSATSSAPAGPAMIARDSPRGPLSDSGTGIAVSGMRSPPRLSGEPEQIDAREQRPDDEHRVSETVEVEQLPVRPVEKRQRRAHLPQIRREQRS